MKNNNFILFDGEEILIQTNQMLESLRELSYKILLIIGVPAMVMCFGFGGFILINGFLNMDFINIFFGVTLNFSALIILMFVFNFTYYLFSKGEKESYYITTSRIIKINKRLFSRTQRLKEISHDEIAYIIYWHDSIEIVTKGANGELHYHGNETDYKKKPRKIKSLDLLLEGIEADKIKEKIRDTLSKTIPMVRHPNLKYLFLSKR